MKGNLLIIALFLISLLAGCKQLNNSIQTNNKLKSKAATAPAEPLYIQFKSKKGSN